MRVACEIAKLLKMRGGIDFDVKRVGAELDSASVRQNFRPHGLRPRLDDALLTYAAEYA